MDKTCPKSLEKKYGKLRAAFAIVQEYAGTFLGVSMQEIGIVIANNRIAGLLLV